MQSRSRLVVIVSFVVLLVVVLLILPKSSRAKGQTSERSSRSNAASSSNHKGSLGQSSTNSTIFALPKPGLKAGPNLAPGSDPSTLPSDVLIADRSNSRLLIVSPSGQVVWQFPRPGDLAPGQSFLLPDDAFFTPNGKDIVVTEEDDQVISLVSIAEHKILWRYGHPGVSGSTANYVSNPDDAMMLPNGDIVTADIKNCSILLLRPPLQVPIERIGQNSTACYHQPPQRFGSPNGAFPLTDGNYLITEINGDWADEMNLQGKVLWSTNPPGVAYPSDSNEISPNRYLTADYSNPGQTVIFNSAGKLLWRYGPASGPGMMNEPSLCRPVPTNGDILCNDDGNDRVIVINPSTNKIVWQYGHDGIAGTSLGYLNRPDGVDLAPPEALTEIHASTMGLPTGHCDSSAPAGSCIYYTSSGAPSQTPTSVTFQGLGKASTTLSSSLTVRRNRTSGQQGKNANGIGSKSSNAEHAKQGSVKKSQVSSQLPNALSREVAVSDGPGEALIFGGLEPSGASSSSVILFDPSNGVWKTAGSLQSPLHDAGGAKLGGRELLFGGGSSVSVSTVEAVTIPRVTGAGSRNVRLDASAVSSVVGNLAVARSDAAAVTIGNTSYVVGGYDGSGADAAVLATTDGKHFSKVADLVVPVRYGAVVADSGKIYVFGGEPASGTSQGSPVSAVQIIDPATHKVSLAGHLPVALTGASAAVVNNHIVITGGDRAVDASGTGSGTNAVIWSFQPSSSRYFVIGRLHSPVSHAGVVTLSSGTWLLGGEENGTVVRAVQRLPG